MMVKLGFNWWVSRDQRRRRQCWKFDLLPLDCHKQNLSGRSQISQERRQWLSNFSVVLSGCLSLLSTKPSCFAQDIKLIQGSVRGWCSGFKPITSCAGFLATRVLPGAIGHPILRTSVKPRYIPLSNSQDPELVWLNSHLCYPSGIDPRSFVISTLKHQMHWILAKGGLPYTTPRGGSVGNPPPRPKSVKMTKFFCLFWIDDGGGVLDGALPYRGIGQF